MLYFFFLLEEEMSTLHLCTVQHGVWVWFDDSQAKLSKRPAPVIIQLINVKLNTKI